MTNIVELRREMSRLRTENIALRCVLEAAIMQIEADDGDMTIVELRNAVEIYESKIPIRLGNTPRAHKGGR